MWDQANVQTDDVLIAASSLVYCPAQPPLHLNTVLQGWKTCVHLDSKGMIVLQNRFAVLAQDINQLVH